MITMQRRCLCLRLAALGQRRALQRPAEDAAVEQRKVEGAARKRRGEVQLIRRQSEEFGKVDVRHLAVQMKKLLSRGRAADALACFEANSEHADTEMFETAISAAGEMMDPGRAMRLLRDMHSARLPRSVDQYDIAMRQLSRGRNSKKTW
eukprot:Hpha_TRINITY_DN3255_c0_g1::TRINITY_DN3255_c0_g1_i1::g.185832::m.185832